jgi:hypothetical protein
VRFWAKGASVGLLVLVFLPALVVPVAAQQGTAINGTLRLQTDAPAQNAVVTMPFQVGGWALDQLAVSGTGVDAVLVWAIPPSGSPAFLGAATLGGSRPDVAAIK